MNVAIILAGGKGVRLGLNVPKQFAEVLGKPVIAYTLDIFQQHPEIDAIEVVCVKGYFDEMWGICRKYGLTKVKWIVEGGASFSESVQKGVFGLEDICADDDIVTIHTGVAPFLEPDFITDNLRVCREKGNAITSFPLYSLAGKRNEQDPEMTNEWFDRDSIVCLKNPHSVRYALIRDMYKEAVKTGLIDRVKPYTTTLMFHMNIPIYLSQGSQMNIKITKKEDLELFEAFVLMKQKQREKNGNEA
ncbi:MAG: 2-C-methyl-D-erythritol 4-phosphate cytidylyltransferase [Oscillospiraceae bacterium]|nr:2-C-methyl-D-erythritol 4-phosphate cytidylyltransferase [Oscillospiraceae bacterium]